MEKVSLSRAQDGDTLAILRLMESAQQHEARARSGIAGEREAAIADRVAAGERLIAIHAELARKKVDPNNPRSRRRSFTAWYEANGLRRMTVYRHMMLAGYTEEKRKVMRQKNAKKQHRYYIRQRREELRPKSYDEAVGPLVLALNELSRQVTADPAAQVVARLRRNFDQGHGLDIGFITTLTRLRSWLDRVIVGAKPFVVHCGKQEKAS